GLPADKEARVDCPRLLRTTGRGSFAKVTLAQMAIRVVKETQQSSSSLQALFHEVHSMKVLNHP
ncbi:hypothetical protein DBR06_SOUSAS1610098, partial [Sousa chinensis]